VYLLSAFVVSLKDVSSLLLVLVLVLVVLVSCAALALIDNSIELFLSFFVTNE